MGYMPPMDRLYLVALPRGELFTYARRVQKGLAHQYGIYEEKLPKLHVTLEMIPVLSPEQLTRILYILDGILHQGPPLALESEGYECFPEPNRSLVLKLKQTREIKLITENIQQQLGIFSLCKDIPHWAFHITLASTIYSSQPWNAEEFQQICDLMPDSGQGIMGYTDCIELWYPRREPEPEVLARFLLK